jgi:hypothetical protein
MRKRWLLLPLSFLVLSVTLAQNSGNYSTAGFDNARTNVNIGLPSAKPPLRLFETIDLSGIGNASALGVFDGYYLAGQAGPGMRYRLFDPSGNALWTVEMAGNGESLNYVPAYAHGVVILGGDGTGDVRAVDVTTGSELWRKRLGATGGRHPVITDNFAILAGQDRVDAVQARTGSVFWQIPVTTAAAPLAAFGNRVYFLEHATTLRAVDVRTGFSMWWVNGIAGDGAGIVASEKLVYVSDPETSTVRAFNSRSGEIVFTRVFPNGQICSSSGLALGFGRLFVFFEDIGTGEAACARSTPSPEKSSGRSWSRQPGSLRPSRQQRHLLLPRGQPEDQSPGRRIRRTPVEPRAPWSARYDGLGLDRSGRQHDCAGERRLLARSGDDKRRGWFNRPPA